MSLIVICFSKLTLAVANSQKVFIENFIVYMKILVTHCVMMATIGDI